MLRNQPPTPKIASGPSEPFMAKLNRDTRCLLSGFVFIHSKYDWLVFQARLKAVSVGAFDERVFGSRRFSVIDAADLKPSSVLQGFRIEMSEIRKQTDLISSVAATQLDPAYLSNPSLGEGGHFQWRQKNS